jgi:hypothetical protein
MRLSVHGLLLAGVLPVLLSACGPSRQVQEDEYNDPRFRGPRESILNRSDDTVINFGKSNKNEEAGATSGIGVNAYLWRGALDTLSFFPLISADAVGGVIITDWYQPPSATGERFKATAYILGRQLRADGVKVSIFRQVQQGGVWVDAPVAPSTITEIEDKVLARARELRTTPGA